MADGSASGTPSMAVISKTLFWMSVAPRPVTMPKPTKAKITVMRMTEMYVARGTVFFGSLDSSP